MKTTTDPGSLTRYAPTPSGYLHIGNLYSFVLTAKLAREKNLEILLRIDDLDRERYRPEYLEFIFRVLHYFDLPWHIGPKNVAEFYGEWSQVHRLSRYQQALDVLRKKGLLYACNCSRSGVSGDHPGCYQQCADRKYSLDLPGYNWRFKTRVKAVELPDLEGNLQHFPFPGSMTDFIVRKKNGQAAYQLSSVVDDDWFGTGWIIRGRDLLDSSLAQVTLADALEMNYSRKTRHFHHPLLLGPEGSKMSKSAGTESLYQEIKSGRSASGILKGLAPLLNNEIFRAPDDFELKERAGI